MKKLASIFVFSIFLFISCDTTEPPKEKPTTDFETELNKIADEYVKVGGMIGVINRQQEKQIYSYGTKVYGTEDPPDANSVFEIGSITKTFTTTLLANLYLNGSFESDTVQHYLPNDKVSLPLENDTPIRFVHLATHTSGIPRSPHNDEVSNYPLPPNFDRQSPYSYYTTSHVYDYLTNYCKLSFETGTFWEYSNTGMGLIGHIVGLVDGSSYNNVLIRDLFNVLGMDRSSIYMTDEQRTNLAQSHNQNFGPGLYFIANDIYQGAGSIKSTLNDMFKYLDAQLGLVPTQLANAILLTHDPVMHQGSLGEQALAWLILNLADGQTVTYHGGDTYGYSSYIGFNKLQSTGVIILLNYEIEGRQLEMGHEIMKLINKY